MRLVMTKSEAAAARSVRRHACPLQPSAALRLLCQDLPERQTDAIPAAEVLSQAREVLPVLPAQPS